MEQDDARWHPFQPDRLPSMFVRAGGETGAGMKKKDSSIASIGEIVKEAAAAISSAFSSRSSLQPSSENPFGSSPAQIIDSPS